MKSLPRCGADIARIREVGTAFYHPSAPLVASRSHPPSIRGMQKNVPVNPRHYATHPARAKLNVPIDFSNTPLLHHTAKSALAADELPESARQGTTQRMNLFQAINSALSHALRTDDRVLLFGEDVSFGGVFRCSMGLSAEYGDERVFNTPLSEQGIVGFAIGTAMEGMKPVAEIQFSDYMYPAYDQLVNEAAKLRYRVGTNAHAQSCGGLVVRMPVSYTHLTLPTKRIV